MQEGQKPFDAEKYVRENSFPLVLSDYSNIGLKLRCIDDRSSKTEGKGHDIAIPGAGLGLVMDTLGALTLLRRKGKHTSVSPSEVERLVEHVIGPITFHTDEKSVKNRGVACGGCAHCSIALADPAKYLLSESDAHYFTDHGLLDLKEKLKERSVKPAVYEGPHAARAVFNVLGTDIGLPSVGKLGSPATISHRAHRGERKLGDKEIEAGEQVYVYHKDFHQLLLTIIAEEMAPLFKTHSRRISSDELEAAMHESAHARLAVTLAKLAVGLPQFVVSNRPRLSVDAV